MKRESRIASIASIDRAIQIVKAYIANNFVAPANLPSLIQNVHTVIDDLSHHAISTELQVEKRTSVEIRASIMHDALVSFIDGEQYKTLKLHLTKHGLTPEAYRVQFGLPADYPMVAASYSEKRSALALGIGLGKRSKKATPEIKIVFDREPDAGRVVAG